MNTNAPQITAGISEDDLRTFVEAFAPIRRPRTLKAQLDEVIFAPTDFTEGWTPCDAPFEIKLGDIVECRDGERLRRVHVVTLPHKCDRPLVEPAFRGREYFGHGRGWSQFVHRWPVSELVRVVGYWHRFAPGEDNQPHWTLRRQHQLAKAAAQ